MNKFASLACFEMALVVALGAFGAHGLKNKLSAYSFEVWNTAVLYLAFAALATLALSSLQSLQGSTSWPLYLIQGGAVIFSSSLFALALGAPRFVGMVTPVGGLGMILGFAAAGLVLVRVTGS